MVRLHIITTYIVGFEDVFVQTNFRCWSEADFDKLHNAGVSEGLTISMATNMAGDRLQSIADSTVRKYNLVFVHFEKYCEQNSLISKPTSPIVIAMHITHLLDQGKTDGVISSTVYGLK